MKWNKHDSRFLTYSLAISVISVFICLYFYSFQINENYLHISLNAKEAKHKALQYIDSRGWDISGYKFGSKYSQSSDNEKIHWYVDWNNNYIKENITDKNKDQIMEIDRLTGANRWNMRWFNPPNTDEINISYTKDGELTYFNHTIPDTLAGDSLPENIAHDIAIMFLQDMTNIDWREDEWAVKEKEVIKQTNRLDYYFEWENKKYKFEESTVRMSIGVKGSKVTDYDRWLFKPNVTKLQFEDWGTIVDFFDRLYVILVFALIIFSILFSLFHHKISTNWNIAA